MGIDVNREDYGDDCLTCFAAGKTPKYLWGSLRDVEKGNGWMPIFPEPPNGDFMLTQHPVVPCFWSGAIGGFTITFETAGPGTLIIIWHPIAGGAFRGFSANDCVWFFSNTQDVPLGWPYFSGEVSLYFREPGSFNSLSDTRDLINMPHDLECKAEVYHLSTDQYVAMFSRKWDNSSIRIKMDKAHYDQYETFEK